MRLPKSLALFAFALAGCAGITTVRTDKTLDLASGPPQGSCESIQFLEVAPAKVFGIGEDVASAGYRMVRVTTYEQAPEGLALFRPGGEVLMLPEVLPRLGEPELARRHLLRVEPINAKLRAQKAWAYATIPLSLGLLAAGTPLLIAGAGNGNGAQAGIGGAMLGGSLLVASIGMIGVLATKPGGMEKIYGDVRNRLFLPGEDDLQAVARGASRYNDAARAGCR